MKEIYSKYENYIKWLQKGVSYQWDLNEESLQKLELNFNKLPQYSKLLKPTHIVIHHAQIDSGNSDYYKFLHKGIFGWDDVGYHYIIGNGIAELSIDGYIEEGRNIQFQGAHVKGHNSYTIGICLTGNFDNYSPTENQIKSLTKLVTELMAKYDIPKENIVGHSDFEDVSKTCPGKLFNIDDYKKNYL